MQPEPPCGVESPSEPKFIVGSEALSEPSLQGSAEELLPLVYQELRDLAAHQLSAQVPGQTLQPTALVHEAWLRLSPREDQLWNGKQHFFAAAAQAMRQILMDRARRVGRRKNGGHLERVELDQVNLAAADDPELLLEVDDALNRLAEFAPEEARLVELRYFCGLTTQEAAATLGVSEATARRQWTFSRAWLYQDLSSSTQKTKDF